MKPVLILKTGSTFPTLRQHYGDFEHWISTVSYTHLTLPTTPYV